MFSKLVRNAVLLALAANVMAQTTFPGEVTCETSDGSPLVSDCEVVRDNLNLSNCYLLNTYGSGCQVLTEAGTCQVVGCTGADGDLDVGVQGHVILGALNELLNCTSGDKVGGYNHLNILQDRNSEWDSNCSGHTSAQTNYVNIEFVHA